MFSHCVSGSHASKRRASTPVPDGDRWVTDMAEAQTAAAEMIRPITPAFVMRLFYAFASLAFLSLGYI